MPGYHYLPKFFLPILFLIPGRLSHCLIPGDAPLKPLFPVPVVAATVPESKEFEEVIDVSDVESPMKKKAKLFDFNHGSRDM